MNQRANILLTDASDIYGGGEYFVLELARTLQERQYQVWVSCRPDNLLAEKCSRSNIPLLPIEYPGRGGLTRILLNLKNFIAARGIDIVHTNNNYDRTAGAIAARLAGAAHVTNIHSFHSIRHNLTHWLRNRMWTDRFLVDGFCVRDLLVKEDGIPASKISVIHLGMDASAVRSDQAARTNVRREFGVRNDEVLIGNVGRLVPMKGQEYLLEAFKGIAQNFPSAKLMLVGDGELKPNLLTAVEHNGLTHRVLLAGFRDDLVALYSAFDLYAHSSVEGAGETFPFAVLQALAQELPVVVTNVGDVAHMVKEGANGFVVDDRNADALGQALSQVLRDSGLRRRMSVESRRLFDREFTLATMVDRIEEVYGALRARDRR